MPKNIVSVRYTATSNAYVTDFNRNLSITSRFVLPPDLNAVNQAEIISAIGATLNEENAPCSDSALGTPRKLLFIRESGNTMSVPITNRLNLLGTAGAIRAILNAANPDNQVVCVKLIGEKFLNLNDEFGVSYDGTVFAPSHKAPAGASKQNFASGVIAYEADAASAFGASVIHGIRSITEKEANEFSAQLGTTPGNCIGDFLTLLNCGNGRRNPRKHRRLTLNFSTKADPADVAEVAQTETIELPIKGGGALDILACMNDAATLQGLYCLGYEGESYDRVHKLLA